MLEIQKYLRSGKTPEDLTKDFGINVYFHPTLPLLGLKYHMLDSPRDNPIVIESRGLVLEKDTYLIIAQPFRRFYNLGEQPELFKDFDWKNFTSHEKCDGSLIILYHYGDEWHVNTSGSFGLGECNTSGKTWRQLFWETSKIDTALLDKNLTYVFELWTPYNKIVRHYPKSTVFLLSAFDVSDHDNPVELSVEAVDTIQKLLDVGRPTQYAFTCLKDIEKFLKEKETTDKTFEGLVVRSKDNIRAKIKSSTYVAMHRMLDNNNIMLPSRQVPLVLAGETDEIYVVMKEMIDSTPELKARIEQTKDEVEAEWVKLKNVWESTYKISDQKQYALQITRGNGGSSMTPFTGLLFSLRKQYGQNQTIVHLRNLWITSADIISKRLYG